MAAENAGIRALHVSDTIYSYSACKLTLIVALSAVSPEHQLKHAVIRKFHYEGLSRYHVLKASRTNDAWHWSILVAVDKLTWPI